MNQDLPTKIHVTHTGAPWYFWLEVKLSSGRKKFISANAPFEIQITNISLREIARKPDLAKRVLKQEDGISLKDAIEIAERHGTVLC